MSQPVRPPARFDRLDHRLRRLFRTELRYAHRHLLALLALALVLGPLATVGAYRLGEHNQRAYDAAYYLHTVKLNGYVTPKGALSPQQPVQPVQSPTGHVLWKFFYSAKENQGTVGFCNCASFVREYAYAFYKQTGINYHFSCRFLYGLLMNLYHQGLDAGSDFASYVPLLAQYGAPLLNEYNWTGAPDSVDNPPEYARLAALPHRYAVVTHTIQLGLGGGQGMIERMEWALHYGHPLDCGSFITPAGTGGFLDANQNNGLIDADQAKPQPTIGGHAFTCVEYDRTMCRVTQWGKTCGFFKIKNQWQHWGLDRLGRPSDGGDFAYMSYRYCLLYCDSIAWLSVHPANPPRAPYIPPFKQPGPDKDRPQAAPSVPMTHKFCIGCDRYVYRVIARDTGQDIAPYINAVARRTGLTATGVAAVIYAECGFFTTSPRCDREAGGNDNSYGCCQITIGTAAQFGLGNGVFDGHYGANATYVRNYENVAAQGIDLGGRVLASFRHIELGDPRLQNGNCPAAAQLPLLYVAWNAGPGQPCSFLSYPTGTAGANYFGNFLGAYRYAQSFGSATDRYARAPFPYTKWGHRVRAYYGHTLALAPRYWWRGHTGLGAARSQRFYRGRPGYSKTVFRKHKAIFCWKQTGRCVVGR